MSYRFQVLDTDGNLLREVSEGELTARIGYSVAWIPRRQAGDARLRIVTETGAVLASAWLTDDRSDLDLRSDKGADKGARPAYLEESERE